MRTDNRLVWETEISGFRQIVRHHGVGYNHHRKDGNDEKSAQKMHAIAYKLLSNVNDGVAHRLLVHINSTSETSMLHAERNEDEVWLIPQPGKPLITEKMNHKITFPHMDANDAIID